MTETYDFSADDEIGLDQGLFLSIGIDTRLDPNHALYLLVGRGLDEQVSQDMVSILPVISKSWLRWEGVKMRGR